MAEDFDVEAMLEAPYKKGGPTQMGLQATVTLNQEMLDRSNIPVDEDSNQEAVEAKIPDKNAPRCTVA